MLSTHRARWSVGWSAFVIVIVVSTLGSSSALASVTDVPVLTSRAYEDSPAATTGFLGWTQNSLAHPKHWDAYAKPTGEHRFQVNAPGTSGSSGGIDSSTLAYDQYTNRDYDIKFFDLQTRRRTNPPSGVNTKQWEYWPKGFNDRG